MPLKYELLIDQIYARTEEAITEKEARSSVEDDPVMFCWMAAN